MVPTASRGKSAESHEALFSQVRNCSASSSRPLRFSMYRNFPVALQLPDEMFANVLSKVPVWHQAAFRLTCKQWCNKISAESLCQSVDACTRRCHLVTLSAGEGDDFKIQYINGLRGHQTALSEQQGAVQKTELTVVLERLNFDPTIKSVVSDIAASVSSLRFDSDRSCLDNKSPVLHWFNFGNLVKLELPLPRQVQGMAPQQFQAALLSMPKLSSLSLTIERFGVQPSAVLVIAPRLPNLKSLKLDTGIWPYCLEATQLQHITSLCLGTAVTFDEPPARLRHLKVTQLSHSNYLMMAQIEALQIPSLSITVHHTDAEGLPQLPVTLHQLNFINPLDLSVDSLFFQSKPDYQVEFNRLKYLRVLMLSDAMSPGLVTLLAGCRFPCLRNFGFRLATKEVQKPAEVLHRGNCTGVVIDVQIHFPELFASLPASTFPVLETIEILEVELTMPCRRFEVLPELHFDLSWMKESFLQIKRVLSRCRNCKLRLVNGPADHDVTRQWA